MRQAVLVWPEWNIVSGKFTVGEATIRGLASVSGNDRNSFEADLKDSLPKGATYHVHYGAPAAAPA